MKTANFTTQELNEFFNDGNIMFFAFRRSYELIKTKDNVFKFKEDKSRHRKEGLPHTQKGRFHALQKNSSYYISSGDKAPKKIEISEYLSDKIDGNFLKAKDLINYLQMHGFKSEKPTEKTALKDLNFKGEQIKSVKIDTIKNLLLITY